jgi:hypothetical protein
MNVSVSLKAKGKGKLRIGAIHKRWSRLELHITWIEIMYKLISFLISKTLSTHNKLSHF